MNGDSEPAWQAVPFDLFGTLVRPLQRAQHQVATTDRAGVLGDECDSLLDRACPGGRSTMIRSTS